MNCSEFTNTLTNVGEIGLDELSIEQQTDFAAHRESCGACRALYAAELGAEAALSAALREMPVPAPSAGFADRVLQSAVVQNGVQNGSPVAGQHHRRGFMMGFGSAAVAALALWVVVGVFPEAVPPTDGVSGETIASLQTQTSGQKTAQAMPVPELSIALHQQKDIKLAFYSGAALKGAKITIRLPENVALVGYPGRRELSWTTDLQKGDNLLRLPVIATQIARGDLVADITYEDRVKTLTLSLEARAADTSTGVSKKTVPFVG